MKTFDFTIVLAAKCDLCESDAEQLFEAGCDDAAPSASNKTALIHFSRHAGSFQQAIVSANADAERAGLKVARVEIGAADISLLKTS